MASTFVHLFRVWSLCFLFSCSISIFGVEDKLYSAYQLVFNLSIRCVQDSGHLTRAERVKVTAGQLVVKLFYF